MVIQVRAHTFECLSMPATELDFLKYIILFHLNMSKNSLHRGGKSKIKDPPVNGKSRCHPHHILPTGPKAQALPEQLT